VSKNEFLLELKHRLRKLPLEEQEQALVYYEEYFNEAGTDSEARVVEELGSPAALAAKIIGEYAVQASGSPRAKTRFGWVTFLAVCAAPLALPLTIGTLALVLSLCIGFMAVGVALAAVAIAGVGSLITGLIVGFTSFPSGLFYVGYGLLLCAIGIPAAKGIWRLSQKTWSRIQLSLGKALMKRGTK